jgi:diguanylate cyclase
MTPSPHPQDRKQALRLRRFLMASSTYTLGITILAMCTWLGLLHTRGLAVLAAAFLSVNVVLFGVFRSGWNLRFADPSLTALQICIAATLVCLILLVGDQLHFLAGTFYSVLFVFAMLKLSVRELVAVEAFMLATYCATVAVRSTLFDGRLDLRVEGVHAVLVVGSSIWYCVAAGFISNLRGRLRESVRTIEQLAIRDALTGTWNRRHLDTLLAAELQRCVRIGQVLCVGLLDIDHFKAVNDRHGHLNGDTVLKNVAACLRSQLRGIDELGRFGGEEFMVLLPGISLAQAQACAERLRRGVADLAAPAGTDARVTVSIGVAELAPGEAAAALIERADRALYRAKSAGRNQVVTDVSQPLACRRCVEGTLLDHPCTSAQ